MDESSKQRPESPCRAEDELVERLVRLVREDGGSEALPSMERTRPWSDLDDAEHLNELCSKLEAESSSNGFVVRIGEASPLGESEARGRVTDWLNRPDPAFDGQCPGQFLNCAGRRKYFETFVASLEGDVFS